MTFLALLAVPATARAQNWSFDARAIGLGGVGGTGNLATGMIDEHRDYRSIVLPFGLLQVFGDLKTFDPGSPQFDPVRAIEYAASPLHYVVGRGTSNSARELFVSDVRNATLSRDLSRYSGFVPDNHLLVEGLVSPSFGGNITVQRNGAGNVHGVYLGAGPYLSMRSSTTIDAGLTNVLASGVNAKNAQFPIVDSTEGQLALAVIGGYRGRFGWPAGIGSGSNREGLYVAVNYNYLHGFRYDDIDMTIRLDTDNAGLLTLTPSTPPLAINKRESTSGSGFAIDLGVGAVVERWEVGFGARGLANRIDWNGLTQTRYTLASLLAGNTNFAENAALPVADIRVELPVDYRESVAYRADRWAAATEVGQGLGGASFHGGVEQRFGRLALRGGARYTVRTWNPTGGIGVDLSPRLSLDVAAFGTSANIERKRQLALAASVRFNRVK